jgi:hypothetical protein
MTNCAESLHLDEDRRREKNWKRWGPYLAERQWGTVREDYSRDGTPWEYFPHSRRRRPSGPRIRTAAGRTCTAATCW